MNKLLGSPKMLEEAKLGRPGHSWIVELLIFLLVFFIGTRAESIPVSIGTVFWLLGNDSAYGSIMNPDTIFFDMTEFLSNMPEWLMILSLFATGLATWVIFVYCRKIEKRSFASMGFRKGSFGREYLLGAIIGILMITAAVVIAMLTSAVTVTPKNLSRPMIGVLLLWLIGYVIQGMSEEVMVRGYLMVSMSRKTPLWICILISSAAFALMHLGNPGIGVLPLFNLFLSGLVFAVLMIKRGSIWSACALHTFWNFYQGCIYGVSVSGTGSVDSALFDCANVYTQELWNGGTFGLEGGLAVTIVEVLALLVILFLVPKARNEQAVLTGPVDAVFTEVKEEPQPAPEKEPVPEAEPTAEKKEEPAADADSSPMY